jgi:hypothetical protein
LSCKVDVIGLRWFRTKKCSGTCWALFALVLQLALSFGHAHHDQIAEPFAASPHLTILDHAASTIVSSSPALPTIPAGLALDYCEICAAVNLVSNGVPANSPQMRAPAGLRQIRFWLQVDAAFAGSPHRPFQARAPPCV